MINLKQCYIAKKVNLCFNKKEENNKINREDIKNRGKNVELIKKIKALFQDKTRKITKKDWILLGTITIIYTIISFINLGSMTNPETFVKLTNNTNIQIEIEGNKTYVKKIRHYSGCETGKYKVLGSIDNIEYKEITEFSDKYVFQWSDTPIKSELKYIKIVGTEKQGYIGEIALYNENDEIIKIVSDEDKGKLLADEQAAVPETIGYMNSTYFDEIYFARSGYEYINGMKAYEWVHPPLGKLIQMIPIAILGMNPFAYRLMGNIAGILMIVVMYIFGKNLFKDSKYALLSGLVMMFDNFHFAQTRMGTVDSFLVLFVILSALFMFKYLILKKEDKLNQKVKYIALSGLFFGLSVSVKWTGLYAGLGLCIVFFAKMIKDIVKDKKIDKQYFYIIAYCIIYFIIIPIAIYMISYLAFPNVRPNGIDGFTGILSQTQKMYDYHSKLVAQHPFTSNWYTWPIMLRPVWLHISYLDNGLKSTITGIRKSSSMVGRSSLYYIFSHKNYKDKKKRRHVPSSNDTFKLASLCIYRKNNVHVSLFCRITICNACGSFIYKMDKR